MLSLSCLCQQFGVLSGVHFVMPPPDVGIGLKRVAVLKRVHALVAPRAHEAPALLDVDEVVRMCGCPRHRLLSMTTDRL